MKRLFAVLLCMVLLLGSAAVPARAGSVSAPAANVTDTSAPRVISVTFKENRKKVADINSRTEDNLSGIRVVKSFANEEIEMAKFKEGVP